MKYYIDITLLPDNQMSFFQLWSNLYTQFHLALVNMQDKQGKVPIGVSFPEYVSDGNFGLLGGKLRVFAQDEISLQKLNLSKWFESLSDYVHCTSIRLVPSKIIGYVIFDRVRVKTNLNRLARRYAKRHQMTIEEALDQHYKEFKDEHLNLPFIRLKSMSNQHNFSLLIKKEKGEQCVMNGFSSYGLSSSSSVPEF